MENFFLAKKWILTDLLFISSRHIGHFVLLLRYGEGRAGGEVGGPDFLRHAEAFGHEDVADVALGEAGVVGVVPGTGELLDIGGRGDAVVFAGEHDHIFAGQERLEFSGADEAHAAGGVFGRYAEAAQAGS